MDEKAILTPQHCEALLIKASGYDGREVDDIAITAWHEAAIAQRWTDFRVAVDSITDYYSRPHHPKERIWIMPGHITEYIRERGRQPAQFDIAAVTGPSPASASVRAKYIKQMIDDLARSKSVSRDAEEKPKLTAEQAAEERRRARDELRRKRWEAVDACSGCDAEGMIVGTAIVCDHVSTMGGAA